MSAEGCRSAATRARSRRASARSRLAESGAPAGSSVPIERGAWARLGACTAAATLVQLDGTLITVALPTVARRLHLAGGTTSLLLTAYFAAYAVMLLPGGRLVDRFGARRVALVGLGLFSAGAAAGGFSSSIGELTATRVLQGTGAGLVSPGALAGAISGFAPERRGRALGVWGASAGVANLLGPLLGGGLSVALGWRADWWALAAFALLAACAIVAYLPRGRGAAADSFTSQALNPVVRRSAFLAALTFAVMVGSFYVSQQCLQRTARYSALGAASVLAIVALLVGLTAPLAGRLADRRGERVPLAAGFLAAGLGLLVLGIPGVPLRNPVSIAPVASAGIGLGMLFAPVSRAALNAVPSSAHGRASALLSVGRVLGAAVGAGAAGLALSGGVTAAAVHNALLAAGAPCIVAGPLSGALLGRPTPRARIADARR